MRFHAKSTLYIIVACWLCIAIVFVRKSSTNTSNVNDSPEVKLGNNEADDSIRNRDDKVGYWKLFILVLKHSAHCILHFAIFLAYCCCRRTK